MIHNRIKQDGVIVTGSESQIKKFICNWLKSNSINSFSVFDTNNIAQAFIFIATSFGITDANHADAQLCLDYARHFVNERIKYGCGQMIFIKASKIYTFATEDTANSILRQEQLLLEWKRIAYEACKYGITANTIELGYFPEAGDSLSSIEAEILLKTQAIRRPMFYYDLCMTLDFLLSGSSSYIVGQTFHLNGGLSLGQLSPNQNEIEGKNSPTDLRHKRNLPASKKNKKILIIGASTGIGEAISLYFAEQGATVIAMARSAEKMSQNAKTIQKNGGRYIVINVDVVNRDDFIAKLSEAWRISGGYDYMIYAAGYFSATQGQEFFDEWNKSIDINLYGFVTACEESIKHWISRGSNGAIVSIGSVDANRVPLSSLEVYGATKAAMEHYAECIALSYAKHGIRTNLVIPGYFSTTFTDWLPKHYKNLWKYNIPMSRFGSPSEVPELVSYLCNNSYVTGEKIYIDGGLMLNSIPYTSDTFLHKNMI